MKIVSSGKVLNSPAFYKKKKLRRRIKYTLVTILFLAAVCSLIYLLRQEDFLIREVVIVEQSTMDKEEITANAENLLAGNYFWVVPRANKFIYPRYSIEQSLLDNFPRLLSVNFKIDTENNLVVTVKEREPFALYCAGALNPDVTSDCYFMDNEGLIFSLAPSFTGNVYFIFSTLTPIEEPIGTNFIPASEFHALLQFMASLKEFDIVPLALGLGDDEYSLSLPNSGQILWKRDVDFNLVYSNLEAFFSDDAIKSQEDFLDKVLYLDLGTENKVRWKFKD